ncbi:hypothetical protein V7O62_02235 [Methanolobus sp. ZRKC2]|uniref:hypothetical protein n=1 Tax=Methanolobus sp. ZRKC2 TaxID=3125783 RepID=UPI0032496712
MDEKTCFIIMPITTPDHTISQYSNDENHFLHVLDYLIIPAVEKAGLKPISPSSRGSDVIHADIIQKIESADFVLCDMSTLNPNVFFELGIRTALNKPVCLIRDDLTPTIPFDTAPIHNHEYSSSLNPWVLENEIENLSKHLTESISQNEDCNSLWKYFSLSSTAHPIKPQEGGINGKIEMLTMQIEALRREQKEVRDIQATTTKIVMPKFTNETFVKELLKYSYQEDIPLKAISYNNEGRIYAYEIDPEQIEEIMEILKPFVSKRGFSTFKENNGIVFEKID